MPGFRHLIPLNPSALVRKPQETKPTPAPGRSPTPAPHEPHDGWDRVHWRDYQIQEKGEIEVPETKDNNVPPAVIPGGRARKLSAKDKRTYSISGFVSADERDLIHKYCAEHKISVATLVRETLFERIGIHSDPIGNSPPKKRKKGS